MEKSRIPLNYGRDLVISKRLSYALETLQTLHTNSPFQLSGELNINSTKRNTFYDFSALSVTHRRRHKKNIFIFLFF